MKKHTWSPLAFPRLTLASPGASGGTPPDENVSKNTQKNVSRSIKIREQISVNKYSEKHLPLQNPLERGGLGEAHLDSACEHAGGGYYVGFSTFQHLQTSCSPLSSD